MNRAQTLHEELVPLLVRGVGARSYLEFGTGRGETILKVGCSVRYGVDRDVELELPFPSRFFRMTTAEFLKREAEALAPFDVVFIDSDHSSRAATDDFLGIWAHVAAEGLVLLHDTNPQTPEDAQPGFCGDSWRVAKWLNSDGYEAVTLPYHPGLTIVRKRARWGPA